MKLDQTGLQLGNFMSYLSQRQEVSPPTSPTPIRPAIRPATSRCPSIFPPRFEEARSVLIVEAPDLPTRNDGNNVSIDREARLLSENTMKFNVAAQMIRAELKNVRSAIEEGRIVMSLFGAISVSASGMEAQRSRAEIITENLANADTTRTPEGGPYRRKDAVFTTAPGRIFLRRRAFGGIRPERGRRRFGYHH